jgi:hypothetical protein
MAATLRKDNKYHVNGIVDIGLAQQYVSALSFGEDTYLAFRNSGSSIITISNSALYEMFEDLSKGKTEKMGFLLGNSYGNSAFFTRYEAVNWIRRDKGSISYRKKDYLGYLRKARSLGFDAQADIHNHTYENLYKLDIQDEERTLPIGNLLRHGLFPSLERSSGFTKYDIHDSRKKHSLLRKMDIFSHSFSGVFERFSLGGNNTKIMLFRIASGPRMENHHGIKITNLSE